MCFAKSLIILLQKRSHFIIFRSLLKRMKLSLTFLLLGFSLISFGQSNGDEILGVWWNPEMTSRVEVYKENGLFYGKIIWLQAD